MKKSETNFTGMLARQRKKLSLPTVLKIFPVNFQLQDF